MSRTLHIRITLDFEGKRYQFIDDHSEFTYKDCDVPSYYWWEEGNGACDCNRSLYIGRHCDQSFPEMKCGHKIKMICQEFIGDWQ